MRITDLPDTYQRALRGLKFADTPLEQIHEKAVAPWQQNGRVRRLYEFPEYQDCALGQSIAAALMSGPRRHLDGIEVHVRATTAVKDPDKSYRLSYVHPIPPAIREMAGFGLVIDVHAKTWQEHFDNEEWGNLVRMIDYSLSMLNKRGMVEQGKTTEPPGFLEVWGPISPHSQAVAKAALEGTKRVEDATEAAEAAPAPKEKVAA